MGKTINIDLEAFELINKEVERTGETKEAIVSEIVKQYFLKRDRRTKRREDIYVIPL